MTRCRKLILLALILGVSLSAEAQQEGTPTHVVSYVYKAQTIANRTLVENNIHGISSITYATNTPPKARKRERNKKANQHK